MAPVEGCIYMVFCNAYLYEKDHSFDTHRMSVYMLFRLGKPKNDHDIHQVTVVSDTRASS